MEADERTDRMTWRKLAVLILLVTLAVLGRLLPHLWNFTPIAAVALFSGAYFGRRYSFFVPLAAMAVSDAVIGFYSYKIMISVYGSFVIISVLGALFKKFKNVETLTLLSLSSSTLFFLVTNAAVWRFSGMYEKTISGLFQSYMMGLPFFRNMMLGDLFYTFILFGAYELYRLYERKRQAKKIRLPCGANLTEISSISQT